jgi:hypothetical protein
MWIVDSSSSVDVGNRRLSPWDRARPARQTPRLPGLSISILAAEIARGGAGNAHRLRNDGLLE